VFAAVIEQAALGVAEHPGLLDATLALRAAQALGMKIARDPTATLCFIQQLSDRKNHGNTLPRAQISDMSHSPTTMKSDGVMSVSSVLR